MSTSAGMGPSAQGLPGSRTLCATSTGRCAPPLLPPYWPTGSLHRDRRRLPAALFVGYICPICALLTPCQAGASAICRRPAGAVQRGVSPRAATACYRRHLVHEADIAHPVLSSRAVSPPGVHRYRAGVRPPITNRPVGLTRTKGMRKRMRGGDTLDERALQGGGHAARRRSGRCHPAPRALLEDSRPARAGRETAGLPTARDAACGADLVERDATLTAAASSEHAVNGGVRTGPRGC